MDSAFPKPSPNKVRLQRYLAQCGIASRRMAEQIIREGRVAVDGRPVTTVGLSVDPATQRVKVDGRPVALQQTVYYRFYKPRGILCTNQDPGGRSTYRECLPAELAERHLFYCGRLDQDSEGLMLLTNDGFLAQRVAHPRHHLVKIYRVWTQTLLSPFIRRRMETIGIVSEGEWLRAVRIIPDGRDGQGWRYRFMLVEGRKRQIRRMCAAAGAEVVRLVRLAIGPIRLKGLKPGECRPLSRDELEALKSATSSAEGTH